MNESQIDEGRFEKQQNKIISSFATNDEKNRKNAYDFIQDNLVGVCS